MTPKKLALALCLLLLACSGASTKPGEEQKKKEDAPPPQSAKKPEETPSPPRALLDPKSPPPFGPEGPVEVTPPIPPLEMGMMDHAYVYGWAKDSSKLGYCVVSGGSGGTDCEFVTPAGKRENLNDFDEAKGEADPARHKAIEDRVKSKGYGAQAPTWLYAPDLVIAWQTIEEITKEPNNALLKVGAKLKGASEPAWVISLVQQEFFTIHPEVIAVSPDGKYLGVISHAFRGEFSDSFQIAISPIAEIAGRGYNDEGYEHQKKGFYEKAAPLFHKAAYTNPTSKVSMYNLACALARLKDPGAEPALRLALDQVGPSIQEKAKKDKDFDGVRQEAWFQALVK